jgi:hypothetical protein
VRLVTGTEPIKSGDVMDIEHIASVLLYADFMVVNRKMKHYVQFFGRDKKYGTAVCCSGDTQLLSEVLGRCLSTVLGIAHAQRVRGTRL